MTTTPASRLRTLALVLACAVGVWKLTRGRNQAALHDGQAVRAVTSLKNTAARMDYDKCAALKARLSSDTAAPVVDHVTFFDGNDDMSSLGCNLDPHPGIASFARTFARLAARDDVQAVYVPIWEIDPGDSCWPYSDQVIVVGDIAPDVLAGAVEELQPDDIAAVGDCALPADLLERLGHPAWVVWWD